MRPRLLKRGTDHAFDARRAVSVSFGTVALHTALGLGQETRSSSLAGGPFRPACPTSTTCPNRTYLWSCWREHRGVAYADPADHPSGPLSEASMSESTDKRGTVFDEPPVTQGCLARPTRSER